MKQLLISLVISSCLFSCAKREILSKSQIETIASQGKVIPNYLPGPCPYPCTDTRCKAYANGYCGPTTTDTIAVIKNSNNPYDYTGLQHNNGVTYVLNRVNPTSPTAGTDILHFTKLYGGSINADTTGFDSWYSYATAHGYFSLHDTVFNITANALNTKLYNDGKIRSVVYTYLNSINNAIDNSVTDNASPSLTLYNTVANKLVTIENTIKNDNSLTSDEKMELLKISAINRYTGAYWANYLSGSSTSTTASQQSNVIALFSLRAWWRRFWHADGVGAVSGAAGGAVGGGAGALWGLLLSAVGGSAAYAIFGD